jgi:anti-sigma factor ChrR (cupin superfamily)
MFFPLVCAYQMGYVAYMKCADKNDNYETSNRSAEVSQEREELELGLFNRLVALAGQRAAQKHQETVQNFGEQLHAAIRQS